MEMETMMVMMRRRKKEQQRAFGGTGVVAGEAAWDFPVIRYVGV